MEKLHKGIVKSQSGDRNRNVTFGKKLQFFFSKFLLKVNTS